MFYCVDASRDNVKIIVEAKDLDELHDLIVVAFPSMKVASVVGQYTFESDAFNFYSLSPSDFANSNIVHKNGTDYCFLRKANPSTVGIQNLSSGSAGATCKKCRNFSPYANPDPNFECYSCKNSVFK